MEDKRIIYVSEYFFPRNEPDAYYLTDISQVFSEKSEYETYIICNSDLCGQQEVEFNKNITRIKESNFNKDNLIQRCLRFFSSSIKMTKEVIVKSRKDDIVFAVTNPAFIIIFLSLVKMFKKYKLYILVYDVFPENLVAAKIISSKSIVYKILSHLYNWAYRKADNLIVIGRDMDDLMQKKVKNQIPTTLITNWADTDSINYYRKQENSKAISWNVTDKIVFCFAGNFGRVQGVDLLLELAGSINDDNFSLLFLGKGAMLEKIQEKADGKKIIYGGTFLAAEKNIFLNSFDIGIVSLSDNMYGLGVPSKTYSNMASGKAILYIGDPSSEIALMVKENKIGWIVKSNDFEGLKTTVLEILKNPAQVREYGDRAREVVVESYSKKSVLKKYEALF
jgi:glycosyltransferase involved in cell wall biosynthesis